MIDLPAFRVEPEMAERLLRRHYDVTGRLVELGSQQDANFAVTTGSGRQYVLKVANPGTTAAELAVQHAAMRHVAAGAGVAVPHVVPGRDGKELHAAEVDGRRVVVRLLTYLPGQPVMDSRYLAPSVVSALGAVTGRVVAALSTFDDPTADRPLQWDLRSATDVVADLVHFVRDPVRRERVLAAAGRAGAALAEVASRLPSQVIHGDITDNNVVFDTGDDGRIEPCGVIDFGDVMHSWRVAELAVLASSLLHHRGASPASVLPAVRAFHAEHPLSAEECGALWPLVVLRAGVLVVSGQQQAAINPSNDYAVSALDREWRILEVSDSVPLAVMRAAVLRAAGHAPEGRPVPPGRALLGDVDAAETVAVDLSVANDELHPGRWQVPGVERELLRTALADGHAAASTRWGEHRLTRARVDRSEPTPTLALGVEVCTRRPERVVAPWDGRLRRTGEDSVVLAGPGPGLVLAGFRPDAPEGDVGAGQRLGTTTAGEPLWVQLSWPGEPPPRFVDPGVGDGWLEACPDPSALMPAPATRAPSGDPALLARRNDAFAPVQEHYFVDPPQVEVGWRHHLVDVHGQSYVDVLNNVTLLGHGHPRLARAVDAQWRRLNTNSRFHYSSVVELSERLAALLPAGLDTVFLVNSGSEANDLALRLAWAATGRRDVVTMRESYHGWTHATDAVSTSVADNPDALATRPPWVHTVDAPNAYRGAHRGDRAHAYAAEAATRIDELARAGSAPAAFICEPFFGNAGGLALPDGYLDRVYRAVRRAGGLCIADEVQVGYGRLGDWFWGFEQQGVVPDIVTTAKGMGNGHPLGAVVTSAATADRYRSQGYFFSSAGGSPVSSVVGLTVLDVLADEGLQDNAREVGAHLRRRLTGLAARHALIGAVHGAGLYLGVELVRDRVSLEPAPAETAAICERLRELGVIVQPTSDRQNVLKVKPPLCLTRESADRFVDALDEALTHGW